MHRAFIYSIVAAHFQFVCALRAHNIKSIPEMKLSLNWIFTRVRFIIHTVVLSMHTAMCVTNPSNRQHELMR